MKRLNYLIKEEKKAPKDYHRLLITLKKKKDKIVIQGIIKQERRHLKKLKKMKRRLK